MLLLNRFALIRCDGGLGCLHVGQQTWILVYYTASFLVLHSFLRVKSSCFGAYQNQALQITCWSGQTLAFHYWIGRLQCRVLLIKWLFRIPPAMVANPCHIYNLVYDGTILTDCLVHINRIVDNLYSFESEFVFNRTLYICRNCYYRQKNIYVIL